MRKWAVALSALVLAACGGGGGGGTTAATTAGTTVTYEEVIAQIQALPAQELSPSEIDTLLFVRQEEKVARDTYATLSDKWPNLAILNEIAYFAPQHSEQNHMNVMKTLIDKYAPLYENLYDPVEKMGDEVGVFENQVLQDRYEEFISCGSQSELDALYVGAYIEEMDLIDLTNRVKQSDNEDIRLGIKFLREGSYRHLRAFVNWIESLGVTYEPQLLCKEDYEKIMQALQNNDDLFNLEPTCSYPDVTELPPPSRCR
ncbi:MAG: DUF2202 domain-containing protein [Aquificae bacterium]|nr:DUF2202 domain-containing protein [Aquificota bacterium]